MLPGWAVEKWLENSDCILVMIYRSLCIKIGWLSNKEIHKTSRRSVGHDRSRTCGTLCACKRIVQFQIKEVPVNETESIDTGCHSDSFDQRMRSQVSSHSKSSRCPTYHRSRRRHNGGADSGISSDQYSSSADRYSDTNAPGYVDADCFCYRR